MSKQANLAGAAQLKTKLSKGQFVYQTLYRTAEESQKAIRAELDARGVEYRSFYLVNAILVKGDRSLAFKLAARPDVKRIDGNPVMRQTLPEPQEAEPLEFNPEWPEVLTGKAITSVEPGISYVRAPSVWALGYTGQGVVVGGRRHRLPLDPSRAQEPLPRLERRHRRPQLQLARRHPLRQRPVRRRLPTPCDDYGHGTHTMGTMVGDDGGANQIGMAPGASGSAAAT